MAFSCLEALPESGCEHLHLSTACDPLSCSNHTRGEVVVTFNGASLGVNPLVTVGALCSVFCRLTVNTPLTLSQLWTNRKSTSVPVPAYLDDRYIDHVQYHVCSGSEYAFHRCVEWLNCAS